MPLLGERTHGSVLAFLQEMQINELKWNEIKEKQIKLKSYDAEQEQEREN